MINHQELLSDAQKALTGSSDAQRDFIEKWVPILYNEVPVLINENNFLRIQNEELIRQIEE